MAHIHITLNKNGGSGGKSNLYLNTSNSKFYSSSDYSTVIVKVSSPSFNQNEFKGYFTGSVSGQMIIDRSGNIVPDAASICASQGGDFTAYAHWNTSFGNPVDYFSLETADGPLMLVSSNSGATRSVVETAGTTGTGSSLKSGHLAIQTANSAVGAFELCGVQLNPTCTYRIRSKGSVSIKLGKAFGSATVTGSGTTSNPYRVSRSGYMLVQAEYGTSADGEPVLIVRGVANEGFTWNSTHTTMTPVLTDAINMWTVSLAVSPDHIAQDPMSAVSGGGEMTECKTLITCDPVVQMENGMPCASDIVHGKVVVTATTNAYDGEVAPTARSPFIEINGVPPDESDVDFITYSFQAERSL